MKIRNAARAILIAGLTFSSFALLAQPFSTGFRAPIEVAFTNQGNLIVAEAGSGPNTGRISLVDRTSGTRRTLIDGLPSGLFREGTSSQPSGPSGLALQGSTLYVTIGGGDSVLPGGPPGTQLPNPNLASPILSSLLSIRTSLTLDLTRGEFTMTVGHHTTLKNGDAVTLTNSANEQLTVALVVDFPDFIAEPRPDLPTNVRLANPFGVAANGQTLYVVDASLNRIFEVDATHGTFTTFSIFGSIVNPLAPMGPPMIDAVPTSVRIRGNELLVTTLTGFPFPQGSAEVRSINRSTGVQSSLITGLTSAIDVHPLGAAPTSSLLALEFSANLLAGQPGRLKLVSPGSAAVVLADGLITATGLAVDQRSGEVFVTHLGPGIITRVNVGALIPRANPSSVIPVIASAPGAFGSRFTTSAQISNPYPFPISGRIVFHSQASTAEPSDPGVDYVLGPFATQSFSDLVGATGGSGLGTADVIAAVGNAPVVVTRIVDIGSPGMPEVQIPQVSISSALTAGTSGTLVTPRDASTSRLNVGIRVLGEPVTMTITLHDGNGAELETVTRTFGANYFVQQPAAELLGSAVGSNQSIVFSIEAGSAIVYGATTGNNGQGMALQIASPVNLQD